VSEEVFVFGLLGLGAAAGLLSRWGPLCGWVALLLPLLVPTAGIGLGITFC
jgi:hypothetical protein